MRTHHATIAIFSFGVLLCGCASEYDGEPRYPLTGTATFNGEPIDLGSISLIPAGGGGRASGGVITDGKYVIPEIKGPNAGTYRVEVHWLKRTGRELLDQETGAMYDERVEALPDQFHKNSELTVEIPATENAHNLGLTASGTG